MTRDVTPISKTDQLNPVPVQCECTDPRCPKTGKPRKKPFRSNGTRHIQRCPCRQCKGGRSKQRGSRTQAALARKVGVPPTRFMSQMGHEENWRHPWFRFEHKAGARDAGPIETRYDACVAQSDASKAVGDNRYAIAAFTPPGSSRTLFVLDDRTLRWLLSFLPEDAA